MVLNLFAECVCQSLETAHVHPHREVLALHERRADVNGSGVPLISRSSCTDTFAGLYRFSLPLRPVNFDEHRVINVVAEHGIDSDPDTGDDHHPLAARN